MDQDPVPSAKDHAAPDAAPLDWPRRRLAARAAGVLALPLGLLVLTGWALGVESLKRVAPGFVPMLPVTASCLSLSALSLLLVTVSSRVARVAGRVVGAFVLYAGLHALSESVFGASPGLRDVFFSAAPDGHRAWGITMSQAAATSFTLFGVCMLGSEARSRWAVHVYVGSASVGLAIAVVSLLGYLFGSDVLLGAGVLQPIAVHAGLGFVVLFAGALALRADQGWPSVLAGARPAVAAGRSLLLLVVLLPVFVAWVVHRGQRAGLYDEDFSLALVTLVTITLLSFLVIAHTKRTSRLHANQLQSAEALRDSEARFRNAADEANRRKDEFLATLGHELRNPLAPIRSAVEILKLQNGTDPGTRRVSEILDRQVTHMTRLVDDLLDVARITSGRIELQKSRVSLKEVVDMAVEASQPSLRAAEQNLTVSLSPVSVEVDGDATRLSQVVLNLLHNAIKFTPRGGTIEVLAEERAEEARITVRDSGVGIDPASIDGIFEMFAQVPASGTGRTGLGIGLALSKALVELHGGRLEAQSDGLGTGSEFTVTLPRAMPASGGMGQSAEGTLPVVSQDGATRVLVVDDNVDAADLLCAHLELQGFVVGRTYDGISALDLVESFAPDAVVLDIGLPGMDGYETARRLRSSSRPPPLLIALTGWGQPEDKARAAEAGFDHHFTKPIDPTTLIGLLRAAGPKR